MEKKINIDQPTLFDDLDSPAYKEFLEYHRKNPNVYIFFKRYALKAIEKGHKHLSADYIFNICRWETQIGDSEDEFRLNNCLKAPYARMFLREFPQHKDFFRIRKSQYDLV